MPRCVFFNNVSLACVLLKHYFVAAEHLQVRDGKVVLRDPPYFDLTLSMHGRSAINSRIHSDQD